jgi:phosphoglycerate dehydrogenase-like enzyme
MKRDSVLLNTARTGLVDLQALAEVLRDRPYMGAGLDVTYEKELTTELLGLENIVLTPHIGFRTNWALSNLAKLAIQNIGDYLFPSHPSRLAAPLTKPSE